MRNFLLVLAFDSRLDNRMADVTGLSERMPAGAKIVMRWETGCAIGYTAPKPIDGVFVDDIIRGKDQYLSVEMEKGGEWSLGVLNRDGNAWLTSHIGIPRRK